MIRRMIEFGILLLLISVGVGLIAHDITGFPFNLL